LMSALVAPRTRHRFRRDEAARRQGHSLIPNRRRTCLFRLLLLRLGRRYRGAQRFVAHLQIAYRGIQRARRALHFRARAHRFRGLAARFHPREYLPAAAASRAAQSAGRACQLFPSTIANCSCCDWQGLPQLFQLPRQTSLLWPPRSRRFRLCCLRALAASAVRQPLLCIRQRCSAGQKKSTVLVLRQSVRILTGFVSNIR